MTEKYQDKENISKKDREAIDYPGVATDIADNEKVDPELVKQGVKELNDNPRDTDGPKLK